MISVSCGSPFDQNKTDDPRAWVLNPGVFVALKLYRERMRPNAETSEPVFLDPQGRARSEFGMAELLRSHLGTIGLREERAQLFDDTPQRKRMCVHDLRDNVRNGRAREQPDRVMD